MKVVLVRKLAEVLDGVDVQRYRVGDFIDLPQLQARLLIAERWAVVNRRDAPGAPPVERRRPHGRPGHTYSPAVSLFELPALVRPR